MGFYFGPILGLITNETARIMFEVKRSGKYIFCYKVFEESDEYMKSLEIELKAGLPSVLQLKQLQRDTTYEYEIIDTLYSEKLTGTFRTLNFPFGLRIPKDENDYIEMDEWKNFEDFHYACGNSCMNIHVVSCNDYLFRDHFYRDDSALKKTIGTNHLWKQIAKQPKGETPVSYTFHIGDQVYTNKACEHIFRHLRKNKDWEEEKGFVKELLKETYRKTWSQPFVREALQNHPNLMFGDDKSILYPRMNRKNRDMVKFVRECSYEVYQEYQRSLRVNPKSAKNCDYFMLQLGNIGYLMLDTTKYKSNDTYLGEEQIEFFKQGVEDWKERIQKWVVICTEPIFQTSGCMKKVYNQVSKKENSLSNGFNRKKYRYELNEFLSIFQHTQKNQLPLFISGDVHLGALFSLRTKNKVENYQVITSGIQKHMPYRDYIGYRLLTWISEKTDKVDGHTYKQFWSQRSCNFLYMEQRIEDIKITFFYHDDEKEVKNFMYTV